MSNRFLNFLVFLLLAAGAALSLYLLFRSLALDRDGFAGGFDLCSIFSTAGCDELLLSSWSRQLGIPVAGWGAIYFLSLAALLALGWTMGESFAREASLAALMVTFAGAAISLALGAAMLARWVEPCPVCLMIHGINLALLYPVRRLNPCSRRDLMVRLASAWKFLIEPATTRSPAALWKITGLITTLLFAVVLYQWVLIEQRAALSGARPVFNPAEALEALELTHVEDLEITEDDPSRGPVEAAVQLVVFSDFECLACADLERFLAIMRRAYLEDLRIVFKHFPLSDQCNPAARVDLHPMACDAAAAARAAQLQDAFWPYHDALFALEYEVDEETLIGIARDADLDLARFEDDRRAAAEKVYRDIDLGVRHGLEATPSVFLNGRQVYDLRPIALRFLIVTEIEAAR